MDDPVWDASSFSKNRDRLLEGEAAAAFLAAILAYPKVRRVMSSKHFSVDGTLIAVLASIKSVKPKAPEDGPADSTDDAPPSDCEHRGRNAEVEFRGQRRPNEKHALTADPDVRLYRKSSGVGAALCFMGHALMENLNGLIVDAELTHATGTAGRVAALAMLEGVKRDEGRCVTLAADRAYDTADFVIEARELNATLHVAQNTGGRRSAIDSRTARQKGHAASQRLRKRIEEFFGWAKAAAGLRKNKFHGLDRVRFAFTLAAAAYNLILIRLPRLLTT